MEHTLSMANSILRQRARVAHIALHATVIESTMKRRAHTPPAQDNWKPTDMKRVEIPTIERETQVGSSLKEEPNEEFPICYVEEIPCPDDIATALEPQETDTKRRRLCKDIPTCYVEEMPCDDECSKRACVVMVHHTDIFAMDRDKAKAEARKETSGEVVTNELHSPLLCASHLDLVFKLRGQMADQEHRALLMGQRLDLLLNTYSNAPANRKFQTCAQSFVIQAKATCQEDKSD
jgi:hypothetical protein